MKPEAAIRRINLFEKRYGKPHLYLAYHAAFPLALTPELLYRLWANFQRDIHGRFLNISWVAVTDILLSALCDEVGHELYEMDGIVRNELLNRLKADKNFGQKRIIQLSEFLLEYIQQQLKSDDLDIRDFAQSQQWTALAYTQPTEAARQLALTFCQLGLDHPRQNQADKTELVRMASLVETFAQPLEEAKLEPLLVYARGMASFARGDLDKATVELSKVAEDGKIQIVGVDLPIPDSIKENLEDSSPPVGPDYSRQTLRGRSFKGQDLTGASFAYSDIRSADFTNAILIGANFTHAQAGLQRRWAIGLTLCSFLLSALSGVISVCIGWILGWEFKANSPPAFLCSIASVIIFAVICIITLGRGLGARAGAIAVTATGAAAIASFEILTLRAVWTQAAQYIGQAVIWIALAGSVILAGALITVGARFRNRALSVALLSGGVGAFIGSAGTVWIWIVHNPSPEAVAIILAVSVAMVGFGAIVIAIAGSMAWKVAAGTTAIAAVLTIVCVLSGLNLSPSSWAMVTTVPWVGTITVTLAWAVIITVSLAIALASVEAGNETFAMTWAVAVFLFGAVGVSFVVVLGSLGIYPPFRIWDDLDIIMFTLIVPAGLGAYIGRRSLVGDRKFAFIEKFSIAFAATGGTSFQGANLTNANFTQATLKSTDFRKANLMGTRWFQAKKLDRACVEAIDLQHPQVQQLMLTKAGQDKNFDNLGLQGINLRQANLADASFINTNLSQANLRGADLSRAKLVKTQLDQADLTGACLTGAYIQDWQITPATNLKGVECQYIFTRLPTQENPDPQRKPDDPRKMFKVGEFARFIRSGDRTVKSENSAKT